MAKQIKKSVTKTTKTGKITKDVTKNTAQRNARQAYKVERYKDKTKRLEATYNARAKTQRAATRAASVTALGASAADTVKSAAKQDATNLQTWQDIMGSTPPNSTQPADQGNSQDNSIGGTVNQYVPKQ